MTDVLELHTADTIQAIADEARFDATRPACPPWCDNTCETTGHAGDSIIHTEAKASALTVPDHTTGGPGRVTVHAWRVDSLDETSVQGIELSVAEARTLLGDNAVLDPSQARKLAGELVAAADSLDPPKRVTELDIPAPDVKIGDLLRVSAEPEFLYVYAVLADEPSNDVQIDVTVDPVEVPEIGEGDEIPHHFTLTDVVRVRRWSNAPTTGGTR
jgi:hypothetical protein